MSTPRSCTARSRPGSPTTSALAGSRSPTCRRTCQAESRSTRGPRTGPTRLLALGLIREYKGIDVLLRAMCDVPGRHPDHRGRDLALAARAHRAARRRSRARGPGRAARRLRPCRRARRPCSPSTMSWPCPYRSATASQNVILGHAHGLPVLASDIAPFSAQIEDGVNGLLVAAGGRARAGRGVAPAGRPAGASPARRRGADPGPLRALGALPRHASRRSPRPTRSTRRHPSPEPSYGRGHPCGRDARRSLARRGAQAASHVRSRRPLLELTKPTCPTGSCRPTSSATRRRRTTRAGSRGPLGLPISLDKVSTWAALGALAAILRVRDDGRRSAIIVDETGPRSILSRWARAVGLRAGGDRLHWCRIRASPPSTSTPARSTSSSGSTLAAATPSDVDNVLEQASWALRSGGLLIVTIPIGPPSRARSDGPGRRAGHPRPGARPRLRARRGHRRRRQRPDARGRRPSASRLSGIRPRPSHAEEALSDSAPPAHRARASSSPS